MVVVNELVDLVKRINKSCIIFKVNFEKSCDSLSSDFLDYMLSRFDFDAKWRSWIRSYVFSISLAVLVNGCPTQEISI